MNKNTSISKLLIVVLFLTTYCNVLVTQLSCNLSNLLEAAEQYHHHNSDVAEHSHGDSHKHNDSKDDNCCNDKTAAFFTSQIQPVTTSFEFKNTYFSKSIFPSNAIVIFLPSFNSDDYFSYQALPPKILDIRVFLHSFLI